MPCVDMNAHPAPTGVSTSTEIYALLDTDHNGCGKLGDDRELTKKVDSNTMMNFNKDNFDTFTAPALGAKFDAFYELHTD